VKPARYRQHGVTESRTTVTPMIGTNGSARTNDHPLRGIHHGQSFSKQRIETFKRETSMMKPQRTVILAALATTTASANLSVDLSALGTGRATDNFSAAYAQINLDPDGMYSVVDDSPFGATDNFPTEGTWLNAGSLQISGTPTGVGVENFTITGASFDFNKFIDGDVTFVGGAYSTDLSNVAGTVEITNGVVTDLNYTSDAAFGFPGLGGLTWDGNFTMTETSFTLFVDDSEDFGFGPANFIWDFEGSSTATVVPEPSVYAFSAGFVTLALAVWQRRRRSAR